MYDVGVVGIGDKVLLFVLFKGVLILVGCVVLIVVVGEGVIIDWVVFY